MCILFGKQAELLKEENANLKARVESLTKRADEAEAKLRKANADSEKEIKERISENTALRNIVAGRDNTIKQLKAEIAKHKPYRGKDGRFASKPRPIGYKTSESDEVQ